ncbi:MAG: hypothetical protein A2Y38_12355 [Spirochaetes bacterium GWB1_59_5]|nr:MAG: hypothetical protein A2Y38_12355 [Spirochaetes bacterium GWB1_59_5]
MVSEVRRAGRGELWSLRPAVQSTSQEVSCAACQRVRSIVARTFEELKAVPADRPIPLELRHNIRRVYELVVVNGMQVSEREAVGERDRYKTD